MLDFEEIDEKLEAERREQRKKKHRQSRIISWVVMAALICGAVVAGVFFIKNMKPDEVPEKVEEIRPSAFINAKIETVTFAGESALKNIGKKAFENSAIKSFVLPAGVAKINEETLSEATDGRHQSKNGRHYCYKYSISCRRLSKREYGWLV